MSIVTVSELQVFAGDERLMGPVSFALGAGETLVIMGETGAGKSLIAQAILGVLPNALRMEGEICVNGRRVDTLTPAERAAMWGHEIATLPQEPWLALDPLMQAWRQVAETHVHVAGLSRPQAQHQTAKDLVALGLNGTEDRLPGQLSGGMAQRVAFAAATAGRAPILLADEPTKGLDSDRRDRVTRLLAQVPKDGGTLLAITHEASVARALGGKIMVLRKGVLVEDGETSSVLTKPQHSYTRDLLAADPVEWEKSEAPPRGDPLLIAEDLTLGRGGKILIDGLNLTVHRGERIACLGPSGVGKSTLLDTLAGLVAPMRGTLCKADGLGSHAVQKLYQDPPAAFPAHVRLGRSLQDVATVHRTPWDQVEANMVALKLSPALLERRPDAVSGGELQRLSIVRALSANPMVLLADEPTSRLDPITQKETMALLGQLTEQLGIAVVLVTHDRGIARAWAQRVLELGPQPEPSHSG